MAVSAVRGQGDFRGFNLAAVAVSSTSAGHGSNAKEVHVEKPKEAPKATKAQESHETNKGGPKIIHAPPSKSKKDEDDSDQQQQHRKPTKTTKHVDEDEPDEVDEEVEKEYLKRVKADKDAGKMPGRMKMIVPPRTVHTPLFELDSVIELRWDYDNNVIEVPEKLMISVQLPKDPHGEPGAKP
ncbi:hypothetical protein IWW57_006449, partial [Coemansia sp. S610]